MSIASIGQKMMFGAYALGAFVALQILLSQSVFAATKTWDGEGADNLFSTAANWNDDAVPVNGDDLIFPVVTAGTYTHDLAPLTNVASIDFRGVSGSDTMHTLSGSLPLSLTGVVTVGERADATVSISGLSTISATNSIMFEGAESSLNLGATPVSVNSASTLAVSSDVTPTSSTDRATGLPMVTFGVVTVPGDSSLTLDEVIASMQSVTGAFEGALTVDNSVVNVDSVPGFAPGAVLAFTNSQLNNAGLGVLTVGSDITFVGNLFGVTGNTISAIADWAAVRNTVEGVTFSSDLTHASDILVHVNDGNVTINGDYTSSYFITVNNEGSANVNLVVASGAGNNSQVPDGTYRALSGDTTVANGDDDSGQDLYLSNGTAIVNGERGDVLVASGATLGGSGVVGDVTVQSGGILAPGTSPGCLAVNNLSLSSGAIFSVEFSEADTTACTGYDQIVVTGTVNLNGATLSSGNTGAFDASGWTVGQEFTIIENDLTDAVTNAFDGAAEGATVTIAVGTTNLDFTISYVGGDGNDVVLTYVGTGTGTPTTGGGGTPPSGGGSVGDGIGADGGDAADDAADVPEAPDTGFGLITSPFGLVGLTSLLSAGGLAFTGRRFQLGSK